MSKKLYYLWLWLLLLWATPARAQSDTTFWFVAPEVTSGSLPNALDRPVVLRFSAFQQASTVRVSEPANAAFVPYNVTVPANQSVALDLTNQLALLENQPAGRALNRGLLIRASQPITAAYEVNSQCGCNDEVFVLKGHTALGTEFFAPFQDIWDNATQYTPLARSSIDVVATENNTQVTLVPTQPTTQGPPFVPVTVLLQRGQTYSLVAAGPTAAEHLGGTRIASTRPIAVTVKDDAVAVLRNSCDGDDLMGDQLLPVSSLGNEYVIVKSSPDDATAILVSTQPGTAITTNGSTSVVALFNAGQTYQVPLSTPATLLQTSAPVYVLHLARAGCELAEALLSPMDCTGARQVNVTRAAGVDSLALTLVVQAGGENSFRFNGQAGVIPAAAFAPVPGSNGRWLAARVPLSLAQLPAGATATVSNAVEVFRMGVLQRRTGFAGSYSYAHYTDDTGFVVDLGPDRQVCAGQSLTLRAGNGPGAVYQWSTGATDSTIAVTQPGTYWVRVRRGPCTGTDTVRVSGSTPTVQVTPPLSICAGSRAVLQAQAAGALAYRWNTGATGPTLTVSQAGTYSVTATLAGGCTAQASTVVTLDALPRFSLGPDTLLCSEERLTLKAPQLANTTFLWNTGSQQPAIDVAQPGLYWLQLTRAGCVFRDSVVVRREDCQPLIPNVITPNGDAANQAFVIRSPRAYQWRLRVFNRWGRPVFESSDYRNDWSAQGEANGLFYYLAENLTLGRRYKGWVEVLGK